MYHGCINVYKEKGFTSFDVIAKLRGILKQKKIGHTGTLDPQAEGVLPVCLGNGTRLCDMLTDKDKVYCAELVLGTVTDTQDMTGQVISRTEKLPDIQAVREVISSFVGACEQVPPMYSAIKVNGKKLYELAREGKTVERKARPVKIYAIDILKEEVPVITIRVHCSKGTYIRTLCHDIGEKLGCGACMGSLLRESAGRFRLEDALTLRQIEDKVAEGSFSSVVIPVDEMFLSYPEITVDEKWDNIVHNGNALTMEQAGVWNPPGEVRVYDSEHRFIGVYRWQEERNCFKPEKMFYLSGR